MEKGSVRVLSVIVGLWLISILLLNFDQLSINSALLVSLIIANLGWTLKLNNDMNDNKMNIALIRQKIIDEEDEDD